MDKARDVASRILLKIELDNAYSSLSLNDALRQYRELNEKDAALVTTLVYGVCERRITLDYNISLYLRSPLKKLHPSVLTYLRLGAYQILFADRIPDRAAVNESVELAKKNKLSFASGLINAVLHKISQNGLVCPDESDRAEYLSVLYSCPTELIRMFNASYGGDVTEEIVRASVGRRPVFIKVNTLKTEAAELLRSLDEHGVCAEYTDTEGCLMIKHTGDITSLEEYKRGLFFVQDKSSQISCRILDASPGDTVVDCCAAPGGKSYFAAVNMENNGHILSCDVYPQKTELIEKGAQRLGISCIQTVCLDARNLRKHIGNADKVLCDVPCSGFGVIGRKPEIRYKKLEEVAGLPALQYEILDSCSDMVRPGGTLVYSTCTLNPAENDGVCDKFLSEHPEFTLCDTGLYAALRGDKKYLTVIPSENGGDGFFTAKMIRS